VDANSPRWHRVTPSTFPWEDEAIDFLRLGINDADPNRAWSNFEFVSGGVISEVDVLLLTRKGAYLIEIKSTPGRLTGDQQRWVFHKPGGGRKVIENPLLGANRKAKRIKSLLEYRWSRAAGASGPNRPPFIQPVVFLSDPELQVELTQDARTHVYGRDGSNVTTSGALPGIFEGVRRIGAAEANNARFQQIDTSTSVAVARALEQIGIKESNHTRRVGSWLLRLDTVSERSGIQDFVADHEQNPGIQRRIRIYSHQPRMAEDQATSLRLAADREFLAAERINHPNVIRALERLETDLGSAVVFDYDSTAIRLDEWLRNTDGLDLNDHLSVLRQLAETIGAVHRRKVTHRSLSPGSILVRPGKSGEPRWVVMVTDFSLAGRDHAASSGSVVGSRFGTHLGTRFGLPTAAPGDAELLADESALLFCAPELSTDDNPDGVSLDVFSFGAIAYEVLSGRPPGDSRESVRESLRAGRGLQLAAAAPGSVDGLCSLVLEATRPLVSERLTSFDDILAGLDLAEEQLTAPSVVTTQTETSTEIDPLNAKAGATLSDGAVVRRRLGRGSTAVALLVDLGDAAPTREVVYKVSLGGDSDARLEAEGVALSGLRHPAIVEMFGTTRLNGRPVLIEALAGTQSLADELRSNGTPNIEFLERWGIDLLEALRYLEREGRWHRDIKPDNLGVTQVGPNKEQHLVLFDFSLSQAPSTDIRAGTPPYLEPFLTDRPNKQWDLNAERYAAAVTLYEMATGELPQWGDGRSDPAFTTSEAILDPLLFDPAARDRLEDFFRRALRRSPEERFGNAEDMLRSWQRLFEGLDTPKTDSGSDAVPGEAFVAEAPVDLPATLSIDDPIISLNAAAKVVSALDRLSVKTVRQLADVAPIEVNRARRISPRVRRRIIELRSAVRIRFSEELATGSTNTGSGPPPTSATVVTNGGEEVEVPRLELDRLVSLLVPQPKRQGASTTEQRAIRILLGLEEMPNSTGSDWPSQAAVADTLGVTRGRIGQIGPQTRSYWVDLVPLGSVRDDIVDIVVANGGVMSVRELEPVIADARGSSLSPAEAVRASRAVVRAAIEAEEAGGGASGIASPRLSVRRRGDRVVVAANLDGILNNSNPAEESSSDENFDGPALAAYAANLGTKADELVQTQVDVIPQDRAIVPLRMVPSPAGVVLSDGRLLRLAAFCSQRVGVSSDLELYPVDLDPERAVRLARQSLAAADALTVDQVHSRVRARFPRVELPDRPELDALLVRAEVKVEWAGSQDQFVRHATVVGNLSTLTSVVSRQPTRMVDGLLVGGGLSQVEPDVAQAQSVEDRLTRSLAQGGFLALKVATSQEPSARLGLERFGYAPYDMVTVDLEQWFLEELRSLAAQRGVNWDNILEADALTSGREFGYLRQLTNEAADNLKERVESAGQRVIAWNPGVLVAFDRLNVIDELRQLAGTAKAELQTLWLVVFGPSGTGSPVIDGQAIPVDGPVEWTDLSDPWLRNVHRQELLVANRAALGKEPS
jgi:serine/threonine protein kinase